MKRLGAALLLIAFTAVTAWAAIDTENKRRAVPTMPGVWIAAEKPGADFDSGDRAHIAFVYRGLFEPDITSTGSTSSGGTIPQIVRKKKGWK